MHKQGASGRDHPVTEIEAKRNRSTVATYLAAVERVVGEMMEELSSSVQGQEECFGHGDARFAQS